MKSIKKENSVIIHLDKPYTELSDKEIEEMMKEVEKLGCERVTVSTDKQTGYKKLIFTCETKPKLEE